MKFLIYKLTNKIDGKNYIGKTNNLNRRIGEHIRQPSCRYLYNALGHHGIHNFEITVIEQGLNEETALEREMDYILKYDSLAPNGYNLTLESVGGRVPSKETRERQSISRQGHKWNKKESSSFLGVAKDRNTYSASIQKDGVFYHKGFKGEKEAAEAYDKIAIHLYGKEAKINFEKCRAKYLSQDLKSFFKFFISRQRSSKYRGVSWDKSCKKWKSYVYINKKQYYLGMFETEELANEARIKRLTLELEIFRQ